MAARSNKRVSEGFYNALNDVSTADFLGKPRLFVFINIVQR